MRKATVLLVGVMLVTSTFLVSSVGSAAVTDPGVSEFTERSVSLASSSPTASFTYSPSTPNPDDTITLDASDSSDNGSITSYEWDTDGDGSYTDYRGSADGETTTVTFGSGGTYTIGLRVTDDNGNTDTTTKQITVENPAPSAEYTFSPSTPNPDDDIALDASGSSDPDGNIVSYEWDTDGDGSYTDYRGSSDGETTTVSFGSGGTYTVGLKVTDNGGKSTTVTKQITVDNPAPSAEYTFSPSTPNPDDDITLDASGSSDPDGNIVSYEWDTDGDGSYTDYRGSSDGEITTVSFGSGGTYTVGLRITDNGGKSRTITKQITVDNPSPSAEYTFSPSVPHPDEDIALDASGSSDPDGNIVSYEWDTDGDGSYTDYQGSSDGETTTVSFDTGGTYTIGLKVTDNGDKTTTVKKQIEVQNTNPSTEFSYSPKNPTPGDEITLDATSSYDPDGQIVSYKWYINERHVGSGETISHMFRDNRAYNATLKVKDNGELTSSSSKTIGVSIPPKPAVSLEPDAIGRDRLVTFDASDSSDPDGEVNTYIWRFSDGETYRGQSVSRQFAQTGRHSVDLTVIDDSSRRNTTTYHFTVHSIPSASISFEPAQPVEGTPVQLRANSSDAIQEYRWDVDGDGSTDYTSQSVEHAFTEYGDHNVTLEIVSDAGIAVQTSRVVAIDRNATFGLTTNRGEIDVGQTVIVTFSISNNIPDRELKTKLELKLPEQGISISSVEGSSIASRSSTTFVTVQGGGDRSIRVRMQFNEPGTYEIGGQSVYYYGNQTNSQQTSVGPVVVSATNESTEDSQRSAPGFGVVVTIIALISAPLLISRD